MFSARPPIFFHLHLVSDSTGETTNAVAKAVCAQFESVQPIEHIHAMVRGPKQLERVLDDIESAPGIVLYTLVNNDLRSHLESRCAALKMPCLSVIGGVLGLFKSYLGIGITHRPGGQHQLDEEYFKRMDALTFTMAHDDGQNTNDLEQAHVLLLGVSRTSKTPTCIYLANRGIKAANIPVVPGCPLPPNLSALLRPLIVGLVATPERLVQLRRSRLLTLEEADETEYVDLAKVREEMTQARRIYEDLGCSLLDVTRKSIEETAAAILNLLQQRGR